MRTCSIGLLTIGVLSTTTFANTGFVGPYNISNWIIVEEGGNVTIEDNGQTLVITGADNGVDGAETDVLIFMPADGVFSFDWEYTSIDDPGFDEAILITGPGNQETLLSDTGGEAGRMCVEATDGNQFGFRVRTDDGLFGPGVLRITNFHAPGGFAYAFHPSNWFIGFGGQLGGGFVNTSSAPNSITVTGSNDGVTENAFIDWCIEAPSDGVICFDWSYSTTDDPGFDEALVYTDTLGFMLLADEDGLSGSEQIAVSEGEVFCFTVESTDSAFGPGVLNIDNFQFKTGFAGPYAPKNWDEQTNADGTVDDSGAPQTVTITGPDDGSDAFGFTDYVNVADGDGIVSFQWSYSSVDDPGFDEAIFFSSFTGNVVLSDTDGESGFACFFLEEGEFFRLTVESDDSLFGPGVLTVTDFNGPLFSCLGDLDGNGSVSGGDLLMLLNDWNAGFVPADLSCDGIVNGTDLLILLNQWGPCS